MTETTNAEQLRIRPEAVVWVVATSIEETALLDPLPQGAVTVDEPVENMDAVVLFAESHEQLVTALDEVLPRVGSTPVIWVVRPAQGHLDIGRDAIATLVGEYGWRPADDTILDETWAAVRLVPA